VGNFVGKNSRVATVLLIAASILAARKLAQYDSGARLAPCFRRGLPQHPQANESIDANFSKLLVRPVYLLSDFRQACSVVSLRV
jgi:hypothetical protein